jgi:hypothetical protein
VSNGNSISFLFKNIFITNYSLFLPRQEAITNNLYIVMKAISNLFKAIRLYLAGIIAVLLIFILLTGLDQGIDIVIQMGEYFRPAAWSVVAVIFWAYLVWYSSRNLSYIKQKKEAETGCDEIIPVWYHQNFPRLMAVNCFASVQFAILCLPTIIAEIPFSVKSWEILLLVLFVNNYLYFELNKSFNKGFGKNINSFLSIILILATIALWVFLLLKSGISMDAVSKDPLRHKFWLPVLGLILFFLEMVIIYLFNLRRKYIDGEIGKQTGNAAKATAFINTEKKFKRWFIFIAVFALAIYFWAISSMRLSDVFGPLAFTLLAIGVLVGLSNLISQYSIKYSVNITLILFIIAIGIGKCHNPYKVELIENHNSVRINLHKNRPSVKAYFKKWLNEPHRKKQLDSCVANNKKFDVYLVLSNGGASRAGDWVSTVMSRLQDETHNRFGEHLLSIAGASGGSVGNSAFYSVLRAQQQGKVESNVSISKHDSLFFTSDFLTYTMGHFLGLDLYGHIIPLSTHDRAAALADVMAGYATDPIVQSYFNTDVDSVFDTTGFLPFFFITTTRVEDGMPGIITGTKLPENSQRLDVLTLMDTIDKKEGRSLKLATAAVLSSRFPYVSPAGKIGDSYFVDGGYFDNAGGGITLEFIQEIKNLLATADSIPSGDSLLWKYDSVFCFHLLHIYNSPNPDTTFAGISPIVNDLFTPMLALAGIQSASTAISNGMLKNYLESQDDSSIINFSLYTEKWPKDTIPKTEEGYPMSWVTSDYQLWRMYLRLQAEDKRNHDRFKNIMPK